MPAFQLFHLPKAALTGGLALKPSWYVNFFLTTTSTPTPVYTTAALDIAHPTDVEANAAGLLPAVYLDPAIVYKASVYDENDVLQYTVDPVNDQILSQSIIGALLYPVLIAEGATVVNVGYRYGHVLRYGTNTTPGTTDITTAVQAACASGYPVIFDKPSGPYYAADITVPAGTTINVNGATLKLKPLSGTVGSGRHAYFKFNGADNVRIFDAVMDGNSSAQSADAGKEDQYALIYAEDSDGFETHNCRFSNTYGNAHVRVIDGSDVRHVNGNHDGTTSPGAGTDLQPGFYYTTSGTRNNYRLSILGYKGNHSHPAVTDSAHATIQYLFGCDIECDVDQGSALNSTCLGVRASGVTARVNLRGGYFPVTNSVGLGLRQQTGFYLTGYIEDTSGDYNPLGIEHCGHDVQIDAILKNCGIGTSNPTCDGVRLRGSIRTTLATVYTDYGIAFGGTGTHKNIDIDVDCYGVGTHTGFNSTDSVSDVRISGIGDLVNDPGASQYVAFNFNSASARAVNRLYIGNSPVKNAQRGTPFFAMAGGGALTVTDSVFNEGPLDSNSFGLSTSGTVVFVDCENRQANPSGFVTITYGASMTPDAIQGDAHRITITNGTAFAVNKPTNLRAGQRLRFKFANTSGGAAGAVTFASEFKTNAAMPATGFFRVIGYFWDGTNLWQEFSTGDIAN